jgi:acyl carrier protein
MAATETVIYLRTLDEVIKIIMKAIELQDPKLTESYLENEHKEGFKDIKLSRFGLDSLDRIEVIFFVEDELELDIPDSQIPGWSRHEDYPINSLALAVTELQKKLQRQPLS